MTRRDIDEELARVAIGQHGAFSRTQAIAAGATPDLIHRRVAAGQWERPCAGVYVLRGSAPTWWRRLKVAELSVPGAAVAARSALSVYDAPGRGWGLPQLSVGPGMRWRSPAARVRRSALPLRTRRVDGFAVVRPEQAMFDVAGELGVAGLERLVDHLVLARLAPLRDFEDLLAVHEHTRLPGIAKLRAVLAERGEGFVVPESELERRMSSLLRAAGVPDLERQAHPPWAPGDRRRFDGLSRAWRVVFEADGRKWHARLRAIERDRRRDLEAAAHGYLTIRLTWAQLTADRAATLADVRSVATWAKRSA